MQSFYAMVKRQKTEEVEGGNESEESQQEHAQNSITSKAKKEDNSSIVQVQLTAKQSSRQLLCSVVRVTSTTIALAWKGSFSKDGIHKTLEEKRGDQILLDETDAEPEVTYRVRYHREAYKTDVWRYSESTIENQHVLAELLPSTDYIIEVQYELLKDKKWVSSDPIQARTWSLEKDERIRNIYRVNTFLQGILEEYPEAEHIPDSYLDKAARSLEGILNVAGMIGAGGKWVKIARDTWKMRQYGLASLIFREDLQKIMIALGTHVGEVAEGIGLSNKELIIGSYYYFWERKRERLIFPDIEEAEHLDEQDEGLIHRKVPMHLLHELGVFLPFARMPYRSEPSSIQWILRTSPYCGDCDNESWRLVCFRNSSGKMKPSFSLFANKSKKRVILGIRGTKEFDDLLTNTSYQSSAVQFCANDSTYYVHAGMKKAAEWLMEGQANDILSIISENPDKLDGAGIGLALQRFINSGYSVTFVGHSLGAGVAIIAALMLAKGVSNEIFQVYAYGTPCCVDGRLAEATKGMESKVKDAVLNRVHVKNFINRDDLVSRLSVHNTKRFAAEIKLHKDRWQPFISQDQDALTKRALSLWAPNQRARPVDPIRSSCCQDKPTKELEYPRTSPVEVLEPTANTNHRLYIPGIIVHSYQYRGTMRASVVDFRFSSFNRIQPFENMIEDHRLDNAAQALRSILAANSAAMQPPVWQSISDDIHLKSEYVKCNVCQYFVGWDSEISGNSEAVELRGTYHCYACGRIVCSECSKRRRTLPEYGIIVPKRVCDVCEYKLGSSVDAWNILHKRLL